MRKVTSTGNSNKHSSIPIGIIVGGGSGRVLAQVFHDFINLIVAKYKPDQSIYWHLPGHEYEFHSGKNVSWDLVVNTEDKNVFGSYELIKQRGGKLAVSQQTSDVTEAIKALSEEEADRLIKYYCSLRKRGVDIAFRTSINAEALYSVRSELEAYKGILLNKNDIDWTKGTVSPSANGTRKVLLVRDQSQGYYANDSYKIENAGLPDERIIFEGHYSKAKIKRIVEFAHERARKRFNEGDYIFWASYKCHLFGNILNSWFREIDPSITVYQPDTGFNKLMDFLNNNFNGADGKPVLAKNLVFLASNEVGDLLYEPFTEILKNTGQKIDLYSRTFFLKSELLGGEFCEYQTVYGSADDIAGANGRSFDMTCEASGRLYPFATLRAAAEVAAEKLGLFGLRAAVDKAVAHTKLKILLHGNFSSIQDTFDYIWDKVTEIYSPNIAADEQ